MIKNTKVYGINEAARVSGFPMATESELCEPSFARMVTLGNAKSGSGHDCALKGILVTFDWTTPVLMQPQIQRYHHIDIVSSQSAMHRLTKFDLDKAFDENTHPIIIEKVKEMIKTYNNWKEDSKTVGIHWKGNRWKTFTKKELWDAIIHSCPQGLLKTAGYVTNYLQLKTMYLQRKGHKLKEWREFCDWCETLPQFKEFVLQNTEENIEYLEKEIARLTKKLTNKKELI